jgi:16S rRNA processing protein RimM
MSPGAGADQATVAVGEIVSAHALRGLVRMRAYQPPAPSLVAGRMVVIDRGDTQWVTRVLSAAPHGRGLVLLALDGVTDRTTAEGLARVRARVLVDVADLPALADGEFYYHELAGFRVETSAGLAVGTIAETFSTGINDVWVVRGGGHEHLIPVIAEVVRSIDRAARRVVIEPVPGLLE